MLQVSSFDVLNELRGSADHTYIVNVTSVLSDYQREHENWGSHVPFRDSQGLSNFCFITAEKGGVHVARVKGEGEKEKDCTTECRSRRRRDEKAP